MLIFDIDTEDFGYFGNLYNNKNVLVYITSGYDYINSEAQDTVRYV